MKATVACLVFLFSLALISAQDCPDISACKRDASELHGKVEAQGSQITELEQVVKQLKADLATANTKITAAEDKLSTAEADAKSAKYDLSKLEKKLSSATASLDTAQSKLARAESDLVAAKSAADEAAGAGSSCKLSLKRAESQISEQKSRLEELKAVEEALLPVWLSRRLIQAQTFTAAQLKALQESDLAAQAATKVAPYIEQARAAVAPHWHQAMEVSKPARETATVYYQQAKTAFDKLPIADTVAAAKQQASVIERELQQTLKAFVATQPSLSALDDPVVLQLLVYTVMGNAT